MKADVGLIGLAVMGQNLVLNLNDKGFSVAVHNRSPNPVREFLARAESEGRSPGSSSKPIVGSESIEGFVGMLERPRTVILLVKAGQAVDDTIAKLLPLLEAGDVIVDGGNSFWKDTDRRAGYLAAKGIRYIGSGVSGGEEGARHGPSLMPGGDPEAWPLVRNMFEAIAARTPDGEACCAWMGPGGSGHFVKMVHNGIEYGDMELIAETYQLLHEMLGLNYDTMASTFGAWNQTELESYLIEISAGILAYKDEDGSPLVESILDAAGQKGTGKWTSQEALDAGVPLTLITEAVYARGLSSLVDERKAASAVLAGPGSATLVAFPAGAERDSLVEDLRKALLAAKIVSYTQGFMLLREADKERSWHLDYGSIAMTWRGGCIIRSTFLGKIKEAFDRNQELPSLAMDPYFASVLGDCQGSLRRVVS
ncbi:MAG: decarboxylating NADP(+)-dependent phosphogluconate dehydrogenase, partial [Spirochaetales bacterium]|nr:decarboxylating NADP(+)-dependent phosphogluconate dehydrogenase [Spirochaetales bacterium]